MIGRGGEEGELDHNILRTVRVMCDGGGLCYYCFDGGGIRGLSLPPLPSVQLTTFWGSFFCVCEPSLRQVDTMGRLCWAAACDAVTAP